MRALVLLIALSFNLISESFAFTCSGTDESGEALVITSNRKEVTIKYGNTPIEILPIFTNDWDGHMTGLITADGISIKYDDHYGCIRNVVITGLLKRDGYGHITTLKFAGCNGGSTPDQLCFPRGHISSKFK